MGRIASHAHIVAAEEASAAKVSRLAKKQVDREFALAACPFCGSAATIKHGKTVMVSCTGCTASTFQELRDSMSAIRAWNRRATLSPAVQAGTAQGETK